MAKWMDSLQSLNLTERLESLNPRERKIVLITAGALVAFIVFSLISSGFKKLQMLDRQLQTTQTTLAKVRTLAGEADAKIRQGQQLTAKIRPATGFYLATFIETQAARFRVPLENLGTETRQDLGEGLEEVSMDVKINSISFPKSLNLLSEIESSPNAFVRVSRIRMKNTANDPTHLELSFKVSAYVRKT